MDVDIFPSRPLGDRKRSWGEEESEPPKKRTPYTWIRERPPVTELDYPIIRQVQNINLGAQGNDIQMIMDEPVRQRLMFFPSSPTPRPVPPPPAKHNKPNTIFCVNSPETSTQSMINATTPELARPNPTQFCSSTKKRFAMGPRADCEKCLAREPGHYGHWL